MNWYGVFQRCSGWASDCVENLGLLRGIDGHEPRRLVSLIFYLIINVFPRRRAGDGASLTLFMFYYYIIIYHHSFYLFTTEIPRSKM